jgi:hypothetical protein
MANFDQIWYLDCPHFTVGRVDQWGEHGYLLFENKVYSYDEDRKEQTGSTNSPQTIAEFLTFAKSNHLAIPGDFMEKLKAAMNG